MAQFPRPGHAGRIALVEARRAVRSLRDRNPVQLLAFAVAALFGLVVTAVAGFGAYVVGGQLAAGEIEEPFGAAAVAAAGVWVMTLFLTAYITVLQAGDVDNRDGLLTTVPHRDVVGGLLLVGFLRVTGFFLLPLVVAAVAFAAGAGSAASLVFALAALVCVLGGAYVVGFPLGLGVKYLLGRSETVVRHKAGLGVLAFAAYMGLLMSDLLGEVLVPLVSAVQASPVAWYADLALLAVAPAASPLRAGAAFAGSVALALGGVLASVRLAGLLWYADPVVAEEGRAESVAAEGRLEGLVDRSTAWVARKSWLRARRAPIKLVYVAYPLFFLFAPLQASFEAGHAVGSLPATLALYGAWATGAAFTLNPLGDEGAVLPVTLTTAVTGRQFVGGLVLAGLLVGLPATVALTAVAGALSTLSAVAVVATVGAAVVLPVGAAAFAAGVGAAFPKFESSRITRSREVVVPSLWAFVAYSLAFLVLGAPATTAQVPTVTNAVAGAASVSPVAVRVGGLALSTALVAAAASASYRYAVGRFEGYTLG